MSNRRTSCQRVRNIQYFYLDDVSVTPPEPGDANGDGKMDINDLTIVLTNFGTSGRTWSQGDFNRPRRRPPCAGHAASATGGRVPNGTRLKGS